jgi:hypothetical protein
MKGETDQRGEKQCQLSALLILHCLWSLLSRHNPFLSTGVPQPGVSSRESLEYALHVDARRAYAALICICPGKARRVRFTSRRRRCVLL